MFLEDYLTGIVIGGIIAIVINLIGASMMAEAAGEKGYGPEAHVFVACFFLGIFGYLYAICLPDKILREQNDAILRQNELIKRGASVQKTRKPSDDLPDL